MSFITAKIGTYGIGKLPRRFTQAVCMARIIDRAGVARLDLTPNPRYNKPKCYNSESIRVLSNLNEKFSLVVKTNKQNVWFATTREIEA